MSPSSRVRTAEAPTLRKLLPSLALPLAVWAVLHAPATLHAGNYTDTDPPAHEDSGPNNLVRLPIFTSASASDLAKQIDYFALGDSVASGLGLFDDGTPCRRSAESYPWLVLQGLETQYEVQNFGFFACSGTTSESLGEQVTQVLKNLSDRPTLVSLTVGANDLGWARLLLQPFARKLCNPNEDEFLRWVDQITRWIDDNLVHWLRQFLGHDNIEIVLTDYYNPTNSSGVFWVVMDRSGTCAGLASLGGAGAIYERTEHVVHSLNFALTRAWIRLGRPERVHLASIHSSFHGHESPHPTCGTAPPDFSQTWIQYIGDPDSNATFGTGDCFHPNRTGAHAYADAVIAIVLPVGR